MTSCPRGGAGLASVDVSRASGGAVCPAYRLTSGSRVGEALTMEQAAQAGEANAPSVVAAPSGSYTLLLGEIAQGGFLRLAVRG